MVYKINQQFCTSCEACSEVCINGAIVPYNGTFAIDENWCAECGSCYALCTDEAIYMAGIEAPKMDEIVEYEIVESVF